MGAHFTNNFSILIQIRWKIHSAPIQVVIKWLLRNFAHGTAAVLSWHAQNFVAISHNGVMLKPNFHRIWITIEKSFVKWALDFMEAIRRWKKSTTRFTWKGSEMQTVFPCHDTISMLYAHPPTQYRVCNLGEFSVSVFHHLESDIFIPYPNIAQLHVTETDFPSRNEAPFLSLYITTVSVMKPASKTTDWRPTGPFKSQALISNGHKFSHPSLTINYVWQ